MTLTGYRTDVVSRLRYILKLKEFVDVYEVYVLSSIDSMINIVRRKLVFLIAPKKFKNWSYLTSVAGQEKYDLGDIPTEDADLLIDEFAFRYEYDRESRSDTLGTGDGVTTAFSGLVNYNKVSTGTFLVTFTAGGTEYTTTDAGDGKIMRGVAEIGAITYTTGAWTVTFTAILTPDDDTSITVAYDTPLYKKLTSKTFDDMSKENNGWRSQASGTPEYAVMWGNDLVLSPPPNISGRQIEVFGLVAPATLSDDDSVCNLPLEYQSYIQPLVLAELLNNQVEVSRLEAKIMTFRNKEKNRGRPKRYASASAYGRNR